MWAWVGMGGCGGCPLSLWRSQPFSFAVGAHYIFLHRDLVKACHFSVSLPLSFLFFFFPPPSPFLPPPSRERASGLGHTLRLSSTPSLPFIFFTFSPWNPTNKHQLDSKQPPNYLIILYKSKKKWVFNWGLMNLTVRCNWMDYNAFWSENSLFLWK
jgi:hypothetical protein